MVKWLELGTVLKSINSGLNPRKNFLLNEDGASNYYVTVKEITTGKIRFDEKTDKISDDALKVIQNRSSLEEGDVLLSGIGTIGKLALVDIPTHNWNCSESVLLLKAKQNLILPSYLKYILSGERVQRIWEKESVGSTLKGIRKASLVKLILPVPSLDEQKVLVKKLDAFTKLISKLDEEIDLRKKQYDYYQDHLLHVDDEDTIRWLSFGEDFVLKARIGWQGLTRKEYREEGSYKLITGTDFTSDNRIDFEHCVYVDKERYDQDPYIQIHEDDVLITKDGTLGKIAYIDKLDMPATLNGGIFVVRDKEKRVLQKFLMYYLNSSLKIQYTA